MHPLRVNSALVVFKKSAYEEYGMDRREIGDAATRRAMRKAHENNARAIEEVRRVLDRTGVRYRLSSRTDLPASRNSDAEPDLVIAVGGDGTFLEASHAVRRGLILGVNSSPDHSVGFFCATTRETFGRFFERILDRPVSVTPMARLQVKIEGKPLPLLALNDVLLTHQSPGATSRYVIHVGARHEIHRSSGIWIATAAGSTAGIRTAGGVLLPIRSDRIQYAVRELYTPPGESRPRLVRGVVPGPRGLRIVNRTADGALFVDGPRHRFTLEIGTRVAIRIAPTPLKVVGFDPSRRT